MRRGCLLLLLLLFIPSSGISLCLGGDRLLCFILVLFDLLHGIVELREKIWQRISNPNYFFLSEDKICSDLYTAAENLEKSLARIPTGLTCNHHPEDEAPDMSAGASNEDESNPDLTRPGCYSDGLTHEAIHAHSWRLPGHKWL